VSDKSWKALERRLARDVGSERIPVTGERAGADFEDGLFVYQAKLGRRCPSYLAAWLAGIRAAGAVRRPAKVGVVVWKPKRAEDADALVLLRWSDWVASAPPRSDGRAKRSEAFPAMICQRQGCGAALPVGERQRGNRRRFCSAHCRRMAWSATRANASEGRPGEKLPKTREFQRVTVEQAA
jgi:hypothetical protein